MIIALCPWGGQAKRDWRRAEDRALLHECTTGGAKRNVIPWASTYRRPYKGIKV